MALQDLHGAPHMSATGIRELKSLRHCNTAVSIHEHDTSRVGCTCMSSHMTGWISPSFYLQHAIRQVGKRQP